LTTHSPLSPELRALIDREREIPSLSATQRARALARARESVATPAPVAAVVPRAAPRPRWIPAAAAVVASAALAAAAYEVHGAFQPARPEPRLGPPATSTVVARSAMPPAPPAPAAAPIAAPPVSRAAAEDAELRLIREAHAAVARGEFAAALRPIAEHERRFKDSRMAEEREALRVKVLAALGRTREARHAAASFRARFPRSVLVPAVGRMLPSDG
jgi:hypothetical protein